jgi:hypothetical protein
MQEGHNAAGTAAAQVLLPGRASAGAAEEGDSIFQRSAADVRAEVLAAQRRREQDSVSAALHLHGCLVCAWFVHVSVCG